MASRVVIPESVTLNISGGDWLLVKKRLNRGEQKALFARRYKAGIDGVRVNLENVDQADVTAYLVDWSLTTPDGKKMAIAGKPTDVVDAFLDSIDADSFAEIKAAIDRHVQSMQAERTAEKNDQDGEKASSAISPSPVAVAGVSSGLPN